MTREEALEVLRLEWYQHEDGSLVEQAIEKAFEALTWVSVEERLPEEGAWVLCYLKGYSYGGKTQVCKFCPADRYKDRPYFEHFRNGFPSVTHWMPLPEPPKEDANA